MFLSVNDRHKQDAVDLARRFHELGFELVATRGTAAAIQSVGIPCKTVFKVNEGRPNAVDPTGAHSFTDEQAIRRTAVFYRVPCITTISGAKAAAQAMVSRRRDPVRVWSLQEIHQPEQTTA